MGTKVSKSGEPGSGDGEVQRAPTSQARQAGRQDRHGQTPCCTAARPAGRAGTQRRRPPSLRRGRVDHAAGHQGRSAARFHAGGGHELLEAGRHRRRPGRARRRSPEGRGRPSDVRAVGDHVERALDGTELGVQMLAPPPLRLQDGVRGYPRGDEPADLGEPLADHRARTESGLRRCAAASGHGRRYWGTSMWRRMVVPWSGVERISTRSQSWCASHRPRPPLWFASGRVRPAITSEM